MPVLFKKIEPGARNLRPLRTQDLGLITGGGPGAWSVEAALEGGSLRGTAGSVGLGYHLPNVSVTGSLSVRGPHFEAGLGAQGTLGRGQWSGGFATDGHDWSTSIQYRLRF